MDSCDVEGLEPLLPEIWISKLETVATSLKDDGLDKAALGRNLRLAFHLCLLAPEPLRIKGLDRTCGACMEALLEARQFDCAAMLLLGTNPELEIQSSEKGANARVRLAAREAVGVAIGATLGQAVLAAIVDCLMMDYALNQEILSYPVAGDRPHRYQSGSHL
ncbi:hypothetical protein [Aurantiacibacter flavus]|uniref:Uncharacterized protein n=1 Tax=Aurantiacibacter flavus TaxID=3145232 RepID=A0ABV0CSR0_9SPHN